MKNIMLLVMLVWVASARALPSFDPFADATASGGTSFAEAAPLYHQTNALGEWWMRWNGGSPLQWVACTNIGLSYGGFPAGFPAPSATNAIHVPGNDDVSGGLAAQSAALMFSRIIAADPNNVSVNAVYASFLIKVPAMGTLAQNATYFGGFATNGASSDDAGISLPSSAMKIFLRGNSATAGSSTTWQIGVANNSGQGSAAYDAGGHTTNTVLFVVVDYEFGINGNPDYARLWVDPPAATFGAVSAPTPTASTSGITGANRVARAADFFLEDRTSGTLWGQLLIGDLRVGTTWTYVTGGPEFTNQPPANSVALDNGNANLGGSAMAAGQSIDYQWQKVTASTTNNLTDAAGSAGGSAIVSGSATSNLTLTGVTAGDMGTYQLLATASSTGYSLTSSEAALVPVADPYINSQPQFMQVNYGSTATFSANAATASGSLAYQWYYNTNTPLSNGIQPDGSSISGASGVVSGNSLSTTLTVSGATWQERGNYVLWVTNAQNATADSTPATLAVNDPYIVSQPASFLTMNQGVATNIAFVANGTGLVYQWYETNSAPVADAGDVSGATTANLMFSNLTFADAGTYYAVASGPGGFVQSTNVVIAVLPIIAEPPGTVTVPPGGATNISVGVAGTNLTYQWYNANSGGALSNTGDFSGVTTANLTITNAQAGDEGVYDLVVTWPNGTEQSTRVVLYVSNDNAELVSISAPTNLPVMPRTVFTQTWTLQNIGTTTWSPGESGYTLRLTGMDNLGAIPQYTNTSLTWYMPSAIIGSGTAVAPGAQATFSMSFIAPEAPGPVTDTFQLYNASGVAFGPVVTVQVVVEQAGSTNQYDRSRAVSYANNYAGYVVSDGYFWTDGSDYSYFGAFAPVPTNPIGDDCAHFVSCCIGSQANQRGGGLQIPSRVPPTYGEPGVARLINTCLIAPGYATEVFSLCDMSPGDLIGWNWEGDTDIEDLDHVTLYLGNGLLASHAVSALDYSTTMFSQNGGPESQWHLIHIFDAPTLTASAMGNNLAISWGTNWTGYALYSATNPSAGAQWSEVSQSPIVVGSSNVVINPISQGAMFYRLMLP